MFDREATKKEFGYWPEELSPGSYKPIFYICAICGKQGRTPRCAYKGDQHACYLCAIRYLRHYRHTEKITVQQLIDDIHRVVKVLNHTPTIKEYKALGNYYPSTVSNRFKKPWREIMASLGYQAQPRVRRSVYTAEQIYTYLNAIRKRLGRIPSHQDYLHLGQIGVDTVKRGLKCKNWTEVLMKVFQLSEQEAARYKSGKSILKPVEYYLEKLQVLAKQLGHTPSASEAIKHGFDSKKVRQLLQTDWLGVLTAAKLDLNTLPSYARASYITDEEILTDIQRVSQILNKVPTMVEYSKYGQVGETVAKKRFGSWVNALTKAGLEIKRNTRMRNVIYPSHPMEYYFEKLRTLANQLGRAPLSTEAAAEKIPASRLTKKLGTNWVGLLKIAGIDASTLPSVFYYLSNEELLMDVKWVFKILGHTPTCREYDKHGKYQFQSIINRFGGSWYNVIAAVKSKTKAGTKATKPLAGNKGQLSRPQRLKR